MTAVDPRRIVTEAFAEAPIDEEPFWSSREVLAHIRNFARARMCSPWAVLGYVMARTNAATPPAVALPPIVGGRGSMNFAVGQVGRSGSGKGAAEAVARDAFSLGERALSFDIHKLGSGQGLAHGFVRRQKDDIVRLADACLFTMHEVDHLVGLAGQQGSTLLAELRSALMGEQLGHLYVDPAKRLEVPAHSYRLAITIGIQPARSGVLLDDADGGTPQRLIWMTTTDPDAPNQPPAAPRPWVWKVPPDWPAELWVCRSAREAIVAARRAELLGAGDPLDGHRLLLREKCAAMLDLMDGEPGVSEEAWELSEVMMAVSDRGRAVCLEALAEKAGRENAARGRRQGERAVIAEAHVREAAIRRVTENVLRKLGDGDWWPRSPLRRSLASDDRGYFDPAVDRAVAAGQVVVDDSGSGTRYRRA